jgi:hypothetical protein
MLSKKVRDFLRYVRARAGFGALIQQNKNHAADSQLKSGFGVPEAEIQAFP